MNTNSNMNTHAPEQQATALPWFTGDDHPSLCAMRDGESVQIATMDTAPFAVGEPEANAAFIVRAVNSHDALVEACKRALKTIEKLPRHVNEDRYEPLMLLSKALALAEGGEK